MFTRSGTRDLLYNGALNDTLSSVHHRYACETVGRLGKINMKLLTVLATLLAVALSYPTLKTWTLNELSNAIEKSEGDPALRKYLIDALNQIMFALFTGNNEESVQAAVLSPSGKRKWTVDELKTAVEDPHLTYALPYYQRSYHYLLNEKPEGTLDEVEVIIPALDVSTWSVAEVSEAIDNPNTKSALQPYLEKAKEEIKKAVEAGVIQDNVTLVTPVGLVPVKKGTKQTIVSFKKL